MDNSAKEAFAKAIGAMLETFGQQATTPILHGYWLGLNDLTLEAVEQAVGKAIQQSDRVPKPVDLRRLAGEQTHEQRAIGAWADVLRALPEGSWKHIDFQDKLINATIRNLGGWPSFLAKFDGGKDQEFARVNFLKTYQAMVAGGVNGEACAPLPGLAEKTSRGGIVQTPVPVRIGCSDPARAKLPANVRPAIEQTRAVPVLTFKKVVD